MGSERLNAFTDGVIAIIITIMVLELKVPSGASFDALRPELPVFGAYLLSFIYVGIYWNNHHHLMQGAKRVDGRVLWSNMGLLFWLSLFPFIIRWVGERGVTSAPIAACGVVLLMAGLAYRILEKALIAVDGQASTISRAVGEGVKEWISVVLYALGIGAAFLISPYVSVAFYVAVALLWFVPDKRFEHRLQAEDKRPT